jgi:hypothetical protein
MAKLTASIVPYSSTVGSSIKLCDVSGRVVAILAIMVPDPAFDYKTVAAEVAEDVTSRLAKRPVAFRVLGMLRTWLYYENEEQAAKEAEKRKTNYQGLYVRDGT